MRWISFINLLFVIIIGVSIIGIVLLLSQPPSIHEPIPVTYEKQLPQRSFYPVDFMTLDQGALSLKWENPSLELPDLSNVIHYHGLIQRPDTLGKNPSFLISLLECDDAHSARSAEPFYLGYRSKQSDPNHYSSEGPCWGAAEVESGYYPSHESTGLWLEMIPRHNGKVLDVTVHMQDEYGKEITSPAKHRRFTVNLQELSKNKIQNWEIGDLRVDSTFLIRQKARWVGKDLFLREHGGEPYKHTHGRERIDFQGVDHPYSCFVKSGDFLVWDGGRWHEGYHFKGATTELPLLSVKKVDEKVISFELWHPEGISKLSLNLIKNRDQLGMPDLSQELRFIGAKTWAQFIVESRSNRLILKPYDWLVLTQEGWVKLDTAEKIDDFVSQKIVGALLVLDKMQTQQGKQILMGHLFNLCRSEFALVEIPSTLNACAIQHSPSVSISESIASGELE